MAHAQTIYLKPSEKDFYETVYEEVIRLNGDCEPFPSRIETYFGQQVRLRESDGKLRSKLRLIHTGKESRAYDLIDNLTKYSYLNYLAIKCWIDTAIEKTPASINQLQYGLHALSQISLSHKAFSSESSFLKEFGAGLTQTLLANKDNQTIVHSLRLFTQYCMENDYWGFDDALISKLSEVKVKSWNQKTRVSLLDHENGPFTRSEVADITNAIEDRLNAEDKVLVKLALRFGLRPIQLALLRVEDLFYDDERLEWYLNIPNVKGRGSNMRRHPRNMTARIVGEELAHEIQLMIQSRQKGLLTSTTNYDSSHPLFPRSEPDKYYLKSKKLKEYAWHSSSRLIGNRFRTIGATLDIPSRYLIDEKTGKPKPLKMNCYRFRYTLGTRMVMEGKTPDEVAAALGHDSLASVNHYFRYNRDLIDFIDDSFESSAAIKNAVARWEGYLIDEDDQIAGSIIRISDIASLGKCLKTSRCEYHPTVTCYGCSRFRPYKHANHEAQLQVIQRERDFIVGNSSGPVVQQLDEALEGAIQIVEAQRRLLNEDSNDE